jgi:hypothetical protein
MEVSGQLHTLVPVEQRLGGPQSQYGCFGEEKNLLPLPGFEPWIFQPVAWSLYGLRYPSFSVCKLTAIIMNVVVRKSSLLTCSAVCAYCNIEIDLFCIVAGSIYLLRKTVN